MPAIIKKFYIQLGKSQHQAFAEIIKGCYKLGWRGGYCYFYNEDDHHQSIFAIESLGGKPFFAITYKKNFDNDSGIRWSYSESYYKRRSYKKQNLEQLKRNLRLIAKSQGKTISEFED